MEDEVGVRQRTVDKVTTGRRFGRADLMAPADLKGSQCTATSKTGNGRCRQRAVHGTNVCRFHGGNAPQVRAVAELRLLGLVDPALARMARIVKKGSDRDALKAAQDILDRCGIGTETDKPSTLVQVHAPTSHTAVEIGTLNTDAMTDEQLAGTRTFLQKLREAIENAPALADGGPS